MYMYSCVPFKQTNKPNSAVRVSYFEKEWFSFFIYKDVHLAALLPTEQTAQRTFFPVHISATCCLLALKY